MLSKNGTHVRVPAGEHGETGHLRSLSTLGLGRRPATPVGEPPPVVARRSRAGAEHPSALSIARPACAPRLHHRHRHLLPHPRHALHGPRAASLFPLTPWSLPLPCPLPALHRDFTGALRYSCISGRYKGKRFDDVEWHCRSFLRRGETRAEASGPRCW